MRRCGCVGRLADDACSVCSRCEEAHFLLRPLGRIEECEAGEAQRSVGDLLWLQRGAPAAHDGRQRQHAEVDKILRRDKRITFIPLAHFSHYRFMTRVTDPPVDGDKALVLAIRGRLLGESHRG